MALAADQLTQARTFKMGNCSNAMVRACVSQDLK